MTPTPGDDPDPGVAEPDLARSVDERPDQQQHPEHVDGESHVTPEGLSIRGGASAWANEVVAQEHPQQNQHADGNAHQVQHEIPDSTALVPSLHVSLLVEPLCTSCATTHDERKRSKTPLNRAAW